MARTLEFSTAFIYSVCHLLIPLSPHRGVALKHDFPGLRNSTVLRIHQSYEDILLPRPPDRPAAETRTGTTTVPAHACNAICKVRMGDNRTDGEPEGRINCHPGEGVAVAWEVLRSAGLVSCPSDWQECEPIDQSPIVKSWLWRSPRSWMEGTKLSLSRSPARKSDEPPIKSSTEATHQQ